MLLEEPTRQCRRCGLGHRQSTDLDIRSHHRPGSAGEDPSERLHIVIVATVTNLHVSLPNRLLVRGIETHKFVLPENGSVTVREPTNSCNIPAVSTGGEEQLRRRSRENCQPAGEREEDQFPGAH